MWSTKYSLRKLDPNDPLVRKGRDHILDSIFVSEDRKKNLFQNYSIAWVANNQHDIDLCLFLPETESPDKWHGLIKIALWRVRFMRTLAKNEKPISIWVWPTDWKKEYPTAGKRILEDNLNSGSTTTYLMGPQKHNNGEICIWRAQEFPKVLVHELVHALRIDNSYPKPREAHTEHMAVLANIYLELLERQLPLRLASHLLEDEKKYGLYQARRLQQYDTGKTNAEAYLSERNRLLWEIPQKTWQEKVRKNPGAQWNFLGPQSLRFTIGDLLLATSGKKRHIPGANSNNVDEFH